MTKDTNDQKPSPATTQDIFKQVQAQQERAMQNPEAAQLEAESLTLFEQMLRRGNLLG